MSKILCHCGNVINMNDGFFMISESDFEELEDPIKLEKFLSKMNTVVKCNICERLYFLDINTVYAKEGLF